MLSGTAISLLAVDSFDRAIEQLNANITDSIALYNRVRDQYRFIGESRARADIFVGLHVVAPNKDREFFRERAADSYLDSIATIANIAYLTQTTIGFDLRTVAHLNELMDKGEVRNASTGFNKMLDDIRGEVVAAMNKVPRERHQLEKRRSKMEVWRRQCQRFSIGFILLGLTIIMFKDLPIWKRSTALH